jgi:hypothetical protein
MIVFIAGIFLRGRKGRILIVIKDRAGAPTTRPTPPDGHFISDTPQTPPFATNERRKSIVDL